MSIIHEDKAAIVRQLQLAQHRGRILVLELKLQGRETEAGQVDVVVGVLTGMIHSLLVNASGKWSGDGGPVLESLERSLEDLKMTLEDIRSNHNVPANVLKALGLIDDFVQAGRKLLG
ncbi:MAG: hypothetical protein PVF33_10440 [Candidatus Latescibacterota bacterium]|jgi:hypothetical protein